MTQNRWIYIVVAVGALMLPRAARAEEDPPASRQPHSAELSDSKLGDWRLESLHQRDGKTRRGVVLAENDGQVEFMEIVQPPGQPMYLVRLPAIDQRNIAAIQRLPGDQRQLLLERIARFSARARIESQRMQDLDLARTRSDHAARWSYRGEWFELESTADEETTRRCAVRVEQILLAYRQVLPPRARGRGGLRILLLGSSDEYRGYLQRLGLEIRNPALYSAPQNLIVAGSDLTRFSQQVEQIRGENAVIRREYESLQIQFAKRLAELGKQLATAGASSDEIKRELASRKTSWDRQRDTHLNRIAEIERRNEQQFDDAAGDMFRRLYHEAFHAYLENFVYRDQRGRIPRWLNEGLAQVFEDGQLDEGVLRIDAPNRERLDRLRSDLRNAPRLSLAQLITAQDDAFLTAHGGDVTERNYLYGWGLAYYLAFELNLLESERLDEYAAAAADKSPLARFERLVGSPLNDFESRWRRFILEYQP